MRIWVSIMGTALAWGGGALGADWHVGAGQAYPTIGGALGAAVDGDRILVHGGRYAEGNIRITRAVELIGMEGAVLDGEGESEVLTIGASQVAVRGFTVCHSGRSSTRDLAGIRVEAARQVVLEENRVRDCHFAIYLAKAENCRVEGNVIEGTPGLEQNSGNGVHLWNCRDIEVVRNRVTGHRDGIYLEFASGSTVVGNQVVENLRYGLHFMFSHDSVYRGNRFSRNGAGVAVMYSRQVEMTENGFDRNWGSSAYGLLLKDVTDSRICGNHFQLNSTAVYAQGATRVSFVRNEFAGNGWALRILASGTDNAFEENNFKGNSFDVGTNGGLSDHRFRRNYWDRYEGYDLDRDGSGDVPFRPVSLYGVIVERVPATLLLSHSLLIGLLDRAERAFPSVTPECVVDEEPVRVPWAVQAAPGKAWMAGISREEGGRD